MEKSMTYRVMSNSIAFIIGFSIIFIFVIGSLGGVITEYVNHHNDVINEVLGVIIIILGIHMLGIFKIKALMSEKRFNLANKKPGLLGSMIVGMAFSFGWVPCTGPILTAIFALTQDSGNYLMSLALMTVYSAGLAIPFLLTALALNQFLKWFQKFKHHLHKVEIVSGILVIGIGVLIFKGGLTSLNQYFTGLGGVGSALEGSVFSSEAKVGFLIAFVGGLISFMSPCVLPLIPMYISYLSGASIGELTGEVKSKPAGEAG
ncbi:cytochrome c biogenesis protein CcdA [bacterium]|nr:cytochrome c biogenesis protein CcdA [bacterium]MBU1025310.1 cytochrome c biogenesis protein CcdA [bacterium]